MVTGPITYADIVATYHRLTPLGTMPQDRLIVPPAVADQAREMFGAERVIVSEFLPPGTAVVCRPPNWMAAP